MNFLIVSAMEEELVPVISKLINEKNSSDNVYFLRTGVGKINASHYLTRRLAKNDIDFVLNVGTCAGVSGCSLFDIVYSKIICSVDVDYCGGEYGCDIVDLDFAKKSLMCSNDKFLITDYYNRIKEQLDALCLKYPVVSYDMETFAYKTFCEFFDFPFLSLRIVTDLPDSEDSEKQFDNNLATATALCANKVPFVLNQIKSVFN
jgi:nucleoside phosphorylase